ncbi:MAG: hypothetical protein M3Y28_07030, partial [Armatimonadota bacterium]|nr:hypothetical protein [Armatimonadota bacterium]
MLGGLSILGLALAGLTCLPNAAAQYPGGGYPGSYGWKALPRQGTSGSNPTDFDWTGQDVDRTVTKYDGTGEDFSFTHLFWDWADNYPIEYTYSGTGGPYGVAHGHLHISGASTYKWQWTPPNKAGTSDPDLENFPLPPLFVLGRVQARVSAQPEDPQNTVGLSATGSVTDGFGDGWNPHFTNTFPGAAPATVAEALRRAVLPAGAEGATTVSVGLSPTVSLDVTGVESWIDPITGYSMSGGNAHDTALLTRAVHPIELSSPDIFKRPDTLGDGGNQYVYGSQQPDGYLYVPGAITVTGGSQDDAQWLVDNNKVDLKVENSTLPGAFTHGWSVAGSRILLDTSYTDENGMQAYSYGWVFKGLPTSNGGFGNHEVNLYVEGSKSETAHIQTFYSGTASNYPGAYLGSDGPGPIYTGIPNWYYYYSQVYAATGDYISGSASNTDQFGNIQIEDDAHGSYTLRVFDRQIDSSGVRRVHYAGGIFLKGIHNYVETCEHEKGHRYSQQNGIATYSGQGTADGDGVDDAWEARNNFDPANSDTAGAYSSLPVGSADYGKGDRECVCDIQALGSVLEQKDLWKQDWASDGLQWGEWFTHNLGVNPAAIAPFFPWSYT